MNDRTAAGADLVVLIVQSNDDARQMYGDFLRHYGVTPIVIGDGAAALKEAGRVDVIVTGIALPGEMDGIELITRLRGDEGTKSIPIVVVTSRAMPNDRERAQQAGCDAFLTKPCLPEDLLSEIRRLVGLRQAQRHPIKAKIQVEASESTKRPA